MKHFSLGNGGTRLQSKPLGGRGRQISVSDLLYRVSVRTARATQRNLVLKNKQTKKESEPGRDRASEGGRKGSRNQ